VPTVYPGATLTPHFRDFLPAWVARQPWYPGTGVPALRPVGFFRFEDPAGETGIETHLVADGGLVCQLPLTYRPAALPGAAAALVATTEHSVLGTRWIYDGPADPAWREELLRLVRTGGVSDPSLKPGAAPAEARGRPLQAAVLASGAVTIELHRILAAGEPATGRDVAGLVTGTWHPGGPGTPAVTGCLATLRTCP
jgi:hypothetical protein